MCSAQATLILLMCNCNSTDSSGASPQPFRSTRSDACAAARRAMGTR